jgi:peptidoglycan/LPS O-acetylase OafA/YrhL
VLCKDAGFLQRRPFKCLIYLGRISYGLYVFHLLAIALVGQVVFIPLLGIQVNFEIRLVLSLLLTVAFAAFSYACLEQPFLKLKERFSTNRAETPKEETPPPPAAVLGFLESGLTDSGIRRGRLPL